MDGLEKRPKTIDDAVEMNLKLQKQITELQTKVRSANDYSVQDCRGAREAIATILTCIAC